MAQQLEEHKKKLEVEQQLAIKRKTAEIAAQHKQERDKEIERAIESMDAEAQAGRRELQDALRYVPHLLSLFPTILGLASNRMQLIIADLYFT